MGSAKEHGMAVEEALSAIAYESGALDTCARCDDVICGKEDAGAAGELARLKYSQGRYHNLFSSADEISNAAKDFVTSSVCDDCYCERSARKDD